MNRVTDIPFDPAHNRLIQFTWDREKIAEQKIGIIERRAAELDNTPSDTDPAKGSVDAYVPSREAPSERVVMQTQNGVSTFSQTIRTTNHRWWGKSTENIHTERFDVQGKNVEVRVVDTNAVRYSWLWGAIQKNDQSTVTQSFNYVRANGAEGKAAAS